MKSSDIHLRVISQEIPQLSGTKISLKIIYLEIHSDPTEANDLTTLYVTRELVWQLRAECPI